MCIMKSRKTFNRNLSLFLWLWKAMGDIHIAFITHMVAFSNSVDFR